MIKFGIEFDDRKIQFVDLSQPKEGNPGVGGSEYLFIMLGTYLSKTAKDIEVIIYHYNNNKLPENIKCIAVNNEYELLEQMDKDKIDVFIHHINRSPDWYEKLNTTGLKSIAWAHVYPEYYEQKIIFACNNVKRIVFVSKEEYDAYVDNDLIRKADYVFNMLNTYMDIPVRKCQGHEVTYVGSLVPAKGFHILAEIWPEIVAQVPDAKLNVVGSGRVYDRNAKLGIYGLAQEDYENLFMKYLTDDEGNIIPSVKFHGLVGKEKKTIIQNTSVGISNPTALSETFCMSAVEMELSGVPVVTRKKWGMLDTVIHKKTGYLFNNRKAFVKYVVRLLTTRSLNIEMGEAARIFVKNTFEAEVLIKKWLTIIEDVHLDRDISYLGVDKHYLNDYKWLKLIIRFFRFGLGIKFFPDYETQKILLRNIKKKTKGIKRNQNKFYNF